MFPLPPRHKRRPLRDISSNVVPPPRSRPTSETDEKKKKSPESICCWPAPAPSPVPAESSKNGNLLCTKEEVARNLKMVLSYLHKCRHVRTAVVRLMKATPEPRYHDLLEGFLANLDKITAYLEKRRGCTTSSLLHDQNTLAGKAQLLKCTTWVQLVVVPFYRQLVANPTACLSLLKSDRSAARKDVIRRLSASSNQALTKAIRQNSQNAVDSRHTTQTPKSVPALETSAEGTVTDLAEK